jgi:hypothetical protein
MPLLAPSCVWIGLKRELAHGLNPAQDRTLALSLESQP